MYKWLQKQKKFFAAFYDFKLNHASLGCCLGSEYDHADWKLKCFGKNPIIK